MAEQWRQTRLDHAITAVFFGFFASAWFGWGHAGASAAVGGWLDAASVVALLVAAAAVVTAFRVPRQRFVARDRSESRRYGIVVGIEFSLIALGAVVLSVAGGAQWVAVWVLAVVAVHFFPLAPVLHNRSLYPLGVLLCALAVAAVLVGLTTDVQPAAVTGAGAGIALLAFAGYDLTYALRRTPAVTPEPGATPG